MQKQDLSNVNRTIANADIDYNVKNVENFLQFEAIKDIKAGEEIFFDYEFDNNIVDFLKQD